MQRMVPQAQQGTRLPAATATPDRLVPPAWEIAALFAVAAFLLAGEALGGPEAHASLNISAPAAIMCILGMGAFQLAWRRENAIWTSLFWLRVSTAIYFGFGSMVPELVNYSSRLYIDVLYRAMPHEVFKLNLIVTTSVALALLAARTLLLFWPPMQARSRATDGKSKLFVLGVIFAIIGYSVRFLIIIPATIGYFNSEIVAGAVFSLGILAPVSLFMLATYAIRHRPGLLPVPAALLAMDLLTGLALFNKSHALISVMMFSFGWLSHRVTLTRGLAAAAAVAAVFHWLPPVVDFGRIEIVKRHGLHSFVGLAERFEIIQDFSRLTEDDPFEEKVQSSLLRLSYVNAACLAINWHDSGSPGPSLDHILAVFIPRILWPNKPDITGIGVEFSIKASGNPNSSTSPGIFADVYWAMGWTGVIPLMLLVGLLFALTSRYALWVLDNGKWEFFPVVLTAMRMGFRVDGYYVADISGPIIFLIAMHVCGLALGPVLDVLLRRRAVA